MMLEAVVGEAHLRSEEDIPYLYKRETKKVTVPVAVKCETESFPDIVHEDEDDTNTVVAEVRHNELICCYDYHILYSESYAVPVLYFNVHKSDGKLLSLEEVWDTVPPIHQERLQSERWTFITQQEHPIFGRPYYHIHPCHTSDLMKQVLSTRLDKMNYLVSWLSSIGQVVGINLPVGYAKAEAIWSGDRFRQSPKAVNLIPGADDDNIEKLLPTGYAKNEDGINLKGRQSPKAINFIPGADDDSRKKTVAY